jgi:dTDP-4-dehydrorhamnose 3,5-epimerase
VEPFGAFDKLPGMKCEPLELKGLLLVQLALHGDARGFFVERYQEAKYRQHGLPTRFIQDNHSRSAPGVLRGLHYQADPAQGKLVGVVRGRIWDVVVDVRPDSSTFGRHYGVELSDINGRLLWIPPGFAHGFAVLGDEPADVLYKVDATYNPAGEGGIRWDDAELAVPWPVQNPTVSSRDKALGSFAEYKARPPRFVVAADASDR